MDVHGGGFFYRFLIFLLTSDSSSNKTKKFGAKINSKKILIWKIAFQITHKDILITKLDISKNEFVLSGAVGKNL